MSLLAFVLTLNLDLSAAVKAVPRQRQLGDELLIIRQHAVALLQPLPGRPPQLVAKAHEAIAHRAALSDVDGPGRQLQLVEPIGDAGAQADAVHTDLVGAHIPACVVILSLDATDSLHQIQVAPAYDLEHRVAAALAQGGAVLASAADIQAPDHRSDFCRIYVAPGRRRGQLAGDHRVLVALSELALHADREHVGLFAVLARHVVDEVLAHTLAVVAAHSHLVPAISILVECVVKITAGSRRVAGHHDLGAWRAERALGDFKDDVGDARTFIDHIKHVV